MHSAHIEIPIVEAFIFFLTNKQKKKFKIIKNVRHKNEPTKFQKIYYSNMF